jgi:hypothetical protein
MRVLYVNTPAYDYLTAAIIEGLNSLADDGIVQLVTMARSNYARASQTWSRLRIHHSRRDFDVCILGTNVEVDQGFFWEVARPGRAICVDGADESAFGQDPARFALYFKRELLTEAPAHVLPCPLALERRWLQSIDYEPRYTLSACFGPRWGERADVLEFLKRSDLTGTYLGTVPSGIVDRVLGVWKGQCSFKRSRWNPFGVGHNRAYYRVLRSSRASLSVRGVGIDTARWWEILGAGALLLSPVYPLSMPHALVPGEHYLSYSKHDELLEQVRWAQTERGLADRMRERARAHCLAHHTTRARAAYVLDAIKKTL